METFHGLCLCGKTTFTNNFHEKLHQHTSFYITLSAKFSFNQSERKLEFDLTFPQRSSWLAVGHLNKLFIRRDGKTPHVVQFNFGLTFLFTSIEPRRWEINSIAQEKYGWPILKNTAWFNSWWSVTRRKFSVIDMSRLSNWIGFLLSKYWDREKYTRQLWTNTVDQIGEILHAETPPAWSCLQRPPIQFGFQLPPLYSSHTLQLSQGHGTKNQHQR